MRSRPRPEIRLDSLLARALLTGVALATAAPPAAAQETGPQRTAAQPAAPPGDEPQPAVDTSRWLCRLCPYPAGWFGNLSFGAGWVSDDSLRFGSYRGLEDEGLFPALGGDFHYRDETGRFWDGYANDLGLDSRRLDLRGGRYGRYELRLGWAEIPTYRGDGAQTPFTGAGGDTLSLPAGWRTGPTTGLMPDLATALRPAPLGLQRETLTAGLTLKFASRWCYEIDYAHEEKDGTRAFGAGVFTINAAHLPAPVDFSTDRFDMGLSLNGERGHLRLGFVGSSFRNGHASVTWQNPFNPVGGTPLLQAALEPDNDFYQLNLAGAWAPRPGLRFSGRVAWGRMRQDDPFLPGYSINPEFGDLPLPRQSLDGEVDAHSLNASGRMSARLGSRLDLVASIRLDERDNRTPVDIWTPVITDLVPRGPGPNLPYSFERDRYRLELAWRAFGSLRLSAGGEHERTGRTLQEVHSTRENTGWGQAAFDPWSFASVRLRLEHSKRDGSSYTQLPNGGLIEHPLQRKFHLADRDRMRWVVELDLAPIERLGVSLAWHESEDDYDRSFIGLRESSDRNVTVDLSYALSRDFTLYAFGTREDIDSTLASAVSAAAAPWAGDTDDRFVTWGLGTTREIGRFSFGVDFVSADSTGRIRVNTSADEPPFPELRTELRNLRLRLAWRFNERWSGKLLAEHEHYDSSDWAVDGRGVDGTPAILALGFDSPDYDVLALRLLASCRF